MDRFRNQVAVVTGASAGIGAAVCKILVHQGMKVVGVARRVDRIEKLADELNSSHPGKLYARKVDLRNDAEITALFDWIKLHLGPVHVLINNAGCLSTGSLLDGDTDAWRRVFEVNVLALCACVREAVKQMRANAIDGHIINVNSVCGHRIYPGLHVGAYGASKFAVTNLSEAVRRELAEWRNRIKVTSLSPGTVATEIFDHVPDKLNAIFNSFEMLSCDDIANAVKYIIDTPPNVEIDELTINITHQDYSVKV